MCQCQTPQYCYQCRPAIRQCNSSFPSLNTGTVGPKGDRGPQGFQGAQGPAGLPGEDGTPAGVFAWRNNNDGTWDLLIDGVAISGGPISFPYNP